MKTSKWVNLFTYIVLCLGIIIIAIPFYLTIVSAFKTNAELHSNFFGLPSSWNLDNFAQIFHKKNYYYALRNSLVITIISLFLCAVCLPMAAYPIARRMHTSKLFKFLYFYMVCGIFVPFMVRMIPVIKIMNSIDLSNNIGLILLYLGGSTCEGIYLITGYLSTVPNDLEEAAYIDGASTFRMFFKIMYPVMQPIIVTILIKNALWFWNDYLLPSVMLKRAEEQTLVLFQYTFKGEFATQYPLVFACLLLSMMPMILFYLFMQKKIIGGMTAGAIKG